MVSLMCQVLARLLAEDFGSPQSFLSRLAQVCSDCGPGFQLQPKDNKLRCASTSNLLASHLLVLLWPKQVTWALPKFKERRKGERNSIS